MSEKLTIPESARLKILEDSISSKAQSIAVSLMQIRDERLYRQDYENFSDYCEKRWKKGRSWADHMIKMAVVVKALPEDLRTMVRNERAARALSCVPEEIRPAVLTHIRDSHKPATSTTIEQSAIKQAKAAPTVDDDGCVIPEQLLELWNRRGEIEELMTAVSKVKCHINSFKEDKDVLFRKISQQAVEQLALAYALLKDAVPYCVCGICEGRLEVLKDKFCKACSSTGFMSEREYKLLVPEEKRKIRKLANAERNGK